MFVGKIYPAARNPQMTGRRISRPPRNRTLLSSDPYFMASRFTAPSNSTMDSDATIDLSSDSELSSVMSVDTTEDENEELKTAGSAGHRRGAISHSPARIPIGATTPPPEDGISMLLRAAPLVPDPPAEDGIAMILRAAVLVERTLIPCTSERCPIPHPHGEGLYQHVGPVPNSQLANVFFAPSIPPPAVVEAFNNIAGLPSWRDLNIKDGFFENHILPCRPSKHLSKQLKAKCNSVHCGVEEISHQKGVYLHDDLDASHSLARQVHHIFGISNPPPKVWEAALRLEKGEATMVDRDLVDDFSAHHGRFEDGTEGVKEFKEWQKERRQVRG